MRAHPLPRALSLPPSRFISFFVFSLLALLGRGRCPALGPAWGAARAPFRGAPRSPRPSRALSGCSRAHVPGAHTPSARAPPFPAPRPPGVPSIPSRAARCPRRETSPPFVVLLRPARGPAEASLWRPGVLGFSLRPRLRAGSERGLPSPRAAGGVSAPRRPAKRGAAPRRRGAVFLGSPPAPVVQGGRGRGWQPGRGVQPPDPTACPAPRPPGERTAALAVWGPSPPGPGSALARQAPVGHPRACGGPPF